MTNAWWSAEEDAKLLELVSQGLSSRDAAEQIPGRTRDACRRRAGFLRRPFVRVMQGELTKEGDISWGAGPGTWESKLIEPWADYSARKKAERAAKREQQERAA